MYGQGVRDGFLVHLYLVRIVDDDIELSEPSILDHDRCSRLRAVFHVTMSVHVGDGHPAEFPSNFTVSAMMVLRGWTSPSRQAVDCIAEPLEAWDRIELDDLVDARHLESLVQVPSQEARGEQYFIASITAHDHAPGSRHDVVFFGVSAHERNEIVACQTDVLEHGLRLSKVRTQCFRQANVALDHSEHGSGTHAGQDLL